MLLYSSVLCNVILCYVISIFYEGLHFLCSDSDPGVVHIPEPVPESSSCEGNQGSALNLFYVPSKNDSELALNLDQQAWVTCLMINS